MRLTDDPADDSTPDFAPDGSQIAFRSERVGGGVYVVSALGGPARLLAPMGRNPRFSPDGRRIVYWVGQPRGGNVGGESALFVLALSGGTPVRVLSDFSVTHEAVWSPDGGSLLVLARRDLTSPLDDVYDWWWVPLDGRQAAKTRVMALPGLRGLEPVPRTWGASGVMFSDGQNLWSVAVSPTSGRPEGAPRRLTAGAGEYVDPTTSRDGQIVFSVRSSLRVVDPCRFPTRCSRRPACTQTGIPFRDAPAYRATGRSSCSSEGLESTEKSGRGISVRIDRSRCFGSRPQPCSMPRFRLTVLALATRFQQRTPLALAMSWRSPAERRA